MKNKKYDRQIIKASISPEEIPNYERFKNRMGTFQNSETIKIAVHLANAYLDFIEKIVPRALFEKYLHRLKYSENAPDPNTKFKLL